MAGKDRTSVAKVLGSQFMDVGTQGRVLGKGCGHRHVTSLRHTVGFFKKRYISKCDLCKRH